MIFNSTNGTLYTSRSYSSGQQSQNTAIKSLIISSGASSIAYAVSQDKKSSSLCSGNQLFSFDPITFSTTARWAKTTTTTTPTGITPNCNHLGITFGSSEKIVYAYSFNSGALKVSRINDSDTSPSIQWTYGFTGTASKSIIRQIAINASSDMLLITGGTLTNTNFGVLIIPTTSPFTPNSTTIYYSTLLNSYQIGGAYLHSVTSISLLLYLSQKTYLCKFTLSGTTSSYSLQETLPNMPFNFQTQGVFSNDGSKYYTASYGYGALYPFNTNLSPSTLNLGTFSQAVIYSSDVTSAAYTLYSASPQAGTLSIAATGVISQANPYNNSTVFAFVDDVAPENQTKDLDLTQLNKPLVTYTIIPVTQTSLKIEIIPGAAASTYPIVPFQAVLSCGTTPPPVFTYTGLKSDFITPYVEANDNISVDSSSGTISVTAFIPKGQYTVFLKGALQDGSWDYAKFTIIINNPPFFSPVLSDQVLFNTDTLQYTLPPLADIDTGQTLLISTATMGPGYFLQFNPTTKTLTFSPTAPTNVGNHTVSVTITDSQSSPVYTFIVTVLPPPTFNSALTTTQTLKIGTSLHYDLPPLYNPLTNDSTGITFVQNSPYSFIVFNTSSYPGSIDITTGLTDFAKVGTWPVQVTLTNSQGSKVYTINVVVTNSAPAFTTLPLTSIFLYLGETKSYKLPSITDAEGHNFTLTYSIPKSFITFNGVDTFTFTAPVAADIGIHTVTVTLDDGSASKAYPFTVRAMTKPAFNDSTPSFSGITVPLNSMGSINVPAFSDADGDIVTISLAEGSGGTLPTWIKINSLNTEVQASPTAFSDIGIHNVQILLTTAYEVVKFPPFTITVTNTAPVFSTTPLASTTVYVNETKTYSLPNINDAEGHYTTITNIIPKSFVTFDNVTTFKFSPTSNADIGTETITVIISDSNLQTTYNFTCTVVTKPAFTDGTTAFAAVTVPLNSVGNFSVPTFSDADNDTVTISIEEGTGGILPTWIKLKNSNLLVEAAPPQNAFTELGTYNVKLVLTTLNENVSFPFTVTATNTAPYFTTTPLNSTVLYVGENKTSVLPSIADAEGHNFTITNLIPKSFITFDNVNTFKLTSPSVSDIGTHTVTVTVSDSNLKTPYNFTVKVMTYPAFNDNTTTFAGLTVPLNSVKSFVVPGFSDADGDAVTISIAEGSGGTLPSWIQLKSGNTSVEAAPIAFSDLGTHNVKLVLTTANENVSFPFTVTATNTPPFFTITPLASTTVYVNETKTYSLPNITDAEGHNITITNLIPKSFISFNNVDTFTFSPTYNSDIGNNIVSVTISDGNMSTQQSFTVKVISKPAFNDNTTTFVGLTLPLNTVKSFAVPTFSDADNDTVTISIAEESGGSLPSWIKLKNQNLLVEAAPPNNNFTNVKIHNIKLVLTTANEFVSFPFKINVTNSAPYFTTAPVKDIWIACNKSYQTVNLANTYKDDENNAITLKSYFTRQGGTRTLIPNGIFTLINFEHIKIQPASFADQGIYTLEYEISDGQPMIYTAYTTVTVYNKQPIFLNATPTDMTIVLNELFVYKLPLYADPDGNAVTVSIEAIPDILKGFAKVQPGGLAINFLPNQQYQIKEYDTIITLSDNDTISKHSNYRFKINVIYIPPSLTKILSPQFSTSIVKMLKVPIKSETLYQLPVLLNSVDLEVVHSTPLPLYVSLQFITYTFKPSLASDLGIASIKGILKNSNGVAAFEFKVSVENEPPSLKMTPKDLKVQIGSQAIVTLGSLYDPEDSPLDIKLETFELNYKTLPAFITFNKETRAYSVAPTIQDNTQKYTIVVQLTDTYGASNKYKFNVDVQKQDTLFKKQQIKSYDAKVKIVEAQIQILKVQRNQKATLMIYAPKGVANLTQQLLMDNKTILFDIIKQSGAQSQNTEVKFVISSVDYGQGIIEVDIKFADSSQISMSSELDQLRVTVTKQITVNLTDIIVYIPMYTVSIRQIPPQLSGLGQAVDMLQGGNLQVSKSKVLNFVFVFFIQLFWSQLDDMSFMLINTLISLTLPGLIQLVLAVLMNFIYFDILLTDYWLPNLFGTTSNILEMEGGLNNFFDENGLQSKSLIKNLGSGFVYIVVYLALVFIYALLSPLSLCFSKQAILYLVNLIIGLKILLCAQRDSSSGIVHWSSFSSSTQLC